MKSSIFTKLTKLLSLPVLILGLTSSSLYAETKKDFKVAWSIYAGWMPWYTIDSEKIIDKWAKKYGINIDVVQVNDYVEAINQYTAGGFDACTMANTDALSIPAVSGVDSTALIVTDYSNGNDMIISKDAKTMQDLKGTKLNLIELSISHYFLARALENSGMSERDISIVNTSDSDIVSAYTTPQISTVVTWKPMVNDILAMPNTNILYDSSKMPEELLAFLFVQTETLEDNPAFAKALVGAWYEMMSLMNGNTTKAKELKTIMGNASGTDLNGYENQLSTTNMYYKPETAIEFVNSKKLMETMEFVAKFSFDHGLYGEGANDYGFVGMQFPNGKVIGDKKNIKLRFDDTYVKMAVEGKL